MFEQKPLVNVYNGKPGKSAREKSPSSPGNDCTNAQAIATPMRSPYPLPESESPFVSNYSFGSSPSSFWSPVSSTTSHTLSPMFSPAHFRLFAPLASATPHHLTGNALALDVRFDPGTAADWLGSHSRGFPVEHGIDPALTFIAPFSASTSDSGNPPATSASTSESSARPSRKRPLLKPKRSDDDAYVEEDGEGDSDREDVAARLKRRRKAIPRKRKGADGPSAIRCDACNISFNRIHDLNRHLRETVAHGAVRDGLWRHACSRCFLNYARDDALKRHHTDTNYDCETADEALREQWVRVWSSNGTMIAPEKTRAKAALRAQKQLK